MRHFYQQIYGFFNYEDVYSSVIKKLPSKSHIVEVGAFKGKSTAYLVVEAINSGKEIIIDIVDSWNGEDESGRKPWSDYNGIHGDIFEEFKINLKRVEEQFNPLRMTSGQAVNLYEDQSLDFVFIDAHHSYEGVKQDIKNWLPKMKLGATFAGHDYNEVSWPGVVQAVNEAFESKFIVIGESWVVHL